MIVAIANALFILSFMDGRTGFAGLLIRASLIAAMLWGMVVMILTLYSMTKKATDIQLYQEMLVINGCTLHAKDIKRIMTQGVFHTVVGILPHGSRLVPMNMTFRFPEEQDKGISDLRKWAERNQVKMGYNTFRNGI